MAGSRSSSSVRRLRGALMTALLLLLVAVGGLFIFGRSGEEVEPPRSIQERGSELAELLLASEGWEYEASQEGRPIFHLRGERMLSDTDNNVVLEEVGLTLYRDNGESWEVQCRRGSYNTESEEAILEGDVEVIGSSGLRLFADGIKVGRGGRLIRSTSAVRFQYQALYEGRADRMSIHLGSGVYLLDGEVRMKSLPSAPIPMSMESNRLVFEDRQNLVRVLGAVRLTHGESALLARRMSIYLSDDRGQLDFIRASGVNASTSRLQPDGIRETLSASGGNLSVVMDPESNTIRDLELEGDSARGPAEVMMEDSTGVVRQVIAPYIVGRDMTPEARTLLAYEPVAFREYFAFTRDSVTAWACADRASISLRDNRLVSLVLDGNSELWREGIFAAGRSIDFDSDGGATTLDGEPARVLHRRGEIAAPAIVQIHHSGEIQAHGGVRGRMNRGEDALAGGGDGLLQLEAEDLVWSEAPESLVLRGRVRVWQGQQLLIAEEIEERPDEERLEARGGVHTVWTPRPREAPEAADSAAEPDATPSLGDQPIEVTAERAVYDRAAGLVTYTGATRATQGLRSLQGEELELQLSDDGKAERIECREKVWIRDPEHQRTVQGDLAVYRPESNEVRISGKRVSLRAEDGTKMDGPVLIYDFATGRARIESESLLDLRSPHGEDR